MALIAETAIQRIKQEVWSGENMTKAILNMAGAAKEFGADTASQTLEYNRKSEEDSEFYPLIIIQVKRRASE